MDDLQEQKTADVENLGKFVFVSSWTDDPTESIPMWKMYTNSTAGVRIKLRKNPFLWHGTSAQDVVRKTGMQLTQDSDSNGMIPTFLDFSEILSKGYWSPQAWSGNILEKMTYTNDITKLEPKVADVTSEGINLKMGMIGKHKNLHWEFQKEWRYIMQFISVKFNASIEEMTNQALVSARKLLQGTEPPPFRYYDLDIDSQCFAEMEITQSPQMTYGNRVILETLVEKYNPSAKIIESELLGKI